MRALILLSCVALGSASAAVPIDQAFWATYAPYRQYSRETIADLIALREGDLLETAREIDGLELRVIGRDSPGSSLVSARVVIDSTARLRLQLKILPFTLSSTGNRDMRTARRQLTPGQADALLALLERHDFWNAPYAIGSDVENANDCFDSGRWILEAFRPGMYQLIARSSCGELDPAAAEIRDFLLDLAGPLDR